MKLAVLIPDRGDRPRFLENCLRMIAAQTLQPDIIELVNDAPLSAERDITWRYRTGYDRLRNRGVHLIALMENDDYYHPTYLETMVAHWNDQGRPDLIGQDHTIYYHIREFGKFVFNHKTRSSAMNTLLRADMEFPWCPDNEPFTDVHLWMKSGLKGVTVRPEKLICMGIKHGVGLCGGRSHVDRLERYLPGKDHEKRFLRVHMDPESFNFYANYYEK